LVQEFKAIDTVAIAKMDATANDTPEELSIQVHPRKNGSSKMAQAKAGI